MKHTTLTTCQPWLHALLVLTLSVLICSSFTTARAAEKEVPPKIRAGETVKQPAASDKSVPSGSSDKKSAMKDGEREGAVKKPGARDGEGGTKVRKGEGDAATTKSGETITLRVSKNGETVMVGDKEVAMSGLRGHLSSFLPEHPGAKIIVTGDADTPLGALHNTVDAVRDNGNKNVGISAQ